MLNTSGFGWNDANQCVTVDTPEILEDYLKKHPNKNYTVNKPFPVYERLKLVSEKNRATGNMTESATNALENMDTENDDDFDIEHNIPFAPSPSNTTSRSPCSKRRRNNKSPGLSKLFEVTNNKIDEATNQMKKLVTIISDSTTEMDGLSNELKTLGLGIGASSSLLP
ncbi:hypothetical protein OSB04_025206 [Centaurea solstitialis]|uniref:Myb/SANT-like domain-containing protein n=1 Tax=Centaurea solstitialis TaxID=347529 RepID=A0AA38SPA6_9ASTR|nr:hypothetical protein OSB04_025206 [Centaurea solstitialis]